MLETIQSVVQEDPLEKEMATHSSILPGESHGQRRLAGYSLYCRKELDATEATEHTHMHIVLLFASNRLY